MGIFSTWARRYWEKGYSVIPVEGKAAKIIGWQQYCDELPSEKILQEWIDRFPNHNIAICIGEQSGLSVLDIDFEMFGLGLELQQMLKGHVPFSPIRTRGRRFMSLYYQVEKCQKWDFQYREENKLEFYGALTNKYFVIPPSIHPDSKTEYIWLDKELLEINRGFIPVFNQNTIYDIARELYFTYGDFSTKAGKGGRNNHYVAIITAMYHRGETRDRILDEVIKEDLHASPPLFSDLSESQMRKRSPRENAERFVDSVLKSLTKFEKQQTITIKELEEKAAIIEPPTPSNYDLPMPTGLLDIMIRYQQADMHNHNRNWCIAGNVQLLSAIISNKFQVQESYSNQYIGFIGPSSSGKTRHIKNLKKLLADAQIDDLTTPAMKSDVAILSYLQFKSKFLYIVDEAAWLLDNKNKSAYHTRIKSILSDLHSAPGTIFQGRFGASDPKGNKEKSVWSPCVSMIFATTDSAFFSAMDQYDVFQGFLNKCMIHFYDGKKEPKAERISNEDYKKMLSALNFLHTSNIGDIQTSLTQRKKAFSLPFADNDTEEAYKLLLDVWSTFTTDLKLDPVTCLASSKFPEFFNKAILTSAVSNCVYDCMISKELMPYVSKHDIIWANNYLKRYFDNNIIALTSSLSASRHEGNLTAVFLMIKKNKKISKTELLRAMRRFPARYLNDLIAQLVQEERIEILKVETDNAKRPTEYFVAL